MEKYIIWGLLAMIIASCSNEEMAEIAEMKQTGIAVTAGLTSNTRINFEQEGDVVYAHWDSDDQITLYADSQGGLDYQVSSIDDAGTKASFSAVKDILQNTDEVIYATYPATTITDGVATLPVTSVWSDTRDMSFAYAVSNVADGKVDLQFKHLYAYLKLTLNAETVSGIDTNEISGLWITNSSGDWISTNSGTYDFNTQTYTITEGTNCMIIEFEETFVANGDAEKVVYIPIIPLGSGNTINLSVLHEDETGCDTLHIISKDTPESGFEAGKVYTYSPAPPFTREGNSIRLRKPGILSQAISEEEKDTITLLKISGPLNGDDIGFIRSMTLIDDLGNPMGKLVDLDISEASIVEGGDRYYADRYTTNDVIGERMFSYTILKRLILPKTVKSIENAAFDRSSYLESIDIPYGVTTIGEVAFSACSSLASITLPESVISIGRSCFFECYALLAVEIPNGITKIDYETFRNCTSLRSVSVPEGVTSIDASAFWGCSSLEDINIPSGVTFIGRRAFSGCSSLKEIAIPNGITTISNEAFGGCSSITNFSIPENVISIGQSAFAGCSSLTSINIPEIVTSIGKCAFLDCSGLTDCIIPQSVVTIGDNAFLGCTSISSVTCKSSTPPILAYETFGLANPATLYVPSGSIANYMQGDWGNYFTYITDGDSHGSYADGVAVVEEAGTLSALISEAEKYNITSLKVVGALNGYDILLLRDMAGADNSYDRTQGQLVDLDLSEATIVSGGCPYKYITARYYTANDTIGVDMFSGTILQNIVLPNNLKAIASNAFLSCKDLESVSIPNGVSFIGGYAFQYCESLQSVSIPESVTVIEDGIFAQCESLSSVNIPKGISTVNINMFVGCHALTNITIPENVSSIGDLAFEYCTSLSEVICEATLPPILGTRAFGGIASPSTLIVPTGCSTAYSESDWAQYFTTIEEK